MNTQNDLVARFQKLLSSLLSRRELEGPLSDVEEAHLAQEMVNLWEQIPQDLLPELEVWIEERKRGYLSKEKHT
jgi:hypothetical protein